MKTEPREKIVKKAYRKPELRIIELAAEEVLGVTCDNLPSFEGSTPDCWPGISSCSLP